MRLLTARTFVVSAALIVLSPKVFAYSCEAQPSISELFEHNDVAVIAKVEKKLFDLSIATNRYLATVTLVKKGEVVPDQIVIWTNRPGRCGAKLEEGKEFVIFLQVVKGAYWTDVNSSWKLGEPIDKYSTEFLEYSLGD